MHPRSIEATAEPPQPAAVRRARLVKSPEEAARIAQNLRADKRIGVGTHLGAATPIDGVGLPYVPCLRPSGVRIRRDALGLIRAVLLGHPLGIGWRGQELDETDSGNNQPGAEVCHLDRRHGRSPGLLRTPRANMRPLGGSGQPRWITNWCRISSAIER